MGDKGKFQFQHLYNDLLVPRSAEINYEFVLDLATPGQVIEIEKELFKLEILVIIRPYTPVYFITSHF